MTVRRRPEEPAVSRRHRARLRARGPERRLQVQQPEREGRVRLRRELQRLSQAVEPSRVPARSFVSAPRVRMRADVMIDFSHNHFELFGLPARFALDAAALDARYRDAAERRASRPLRRRRARRERRARAAVRRRASTRRTARCKDPVERARYLLALHGVDALAETDTALPLRFPRCSSSSGARRSTDARAGARCAARSTRCSTTCAARRDELERVLADELDDARRCDAARADRARAQVPVEGRRRHRRDARDEPTAID